MMDWDEDDCCEDPTESGPWAGTNPFTVHAHRCPDCGIVWSHDPANFGEAGSMSHIEAHTCPGCAEYVTLVYWGPDNATYHCGVEVVRGSQG
jgi:hypothetical protein